MPSIFISHISEEAQIAGSLKDFIEAKFLKFVRVFASSHPESIRLGDDWLRAVRASIHECDAMIVVCSPISINRPWVNFEAGAGWSREIPVMPMCHSGLEPGNLPAPLNSFQGGIVRNQEDVQKCFATIASLYGASPPNATDDEFYSSIILYEKNAQSNILVKDSTFIEKILTVHIRQLKYLIYASTQDIAEINKYSARDMENYNFDFSSLGNLLNHNLQLNSMGEKVYQTLQANVMKIEESIKFILSNRRLQLAPELEETLNAFLFATPLIYEPHNSLNKLSQMFADNERNSLNMLHFSWKESIKKNKF